MFKLTKKIIQNELTYKGNVIVKYKIEYPQIFSNCYSTCHFNSVNFERALELETYAKETLFEESKKTYDYNLANGYPIMVYELILETNITYNKSPILSLYQDQYTFTGGAHGSTVRTSQNWNLKDTSIIPLSNFFPNNTYYTIDILKEINKKNNKERK